MTITPIKPDHQPISPFNSFWELLRTPQSRKLRKPLQQKKPPQPGWYPDRSHRIADKWRSNLHLGSHCVLSTQQLQQMKQLQQLSPSTPAILYSNIHFLVKFCTIVWIGWMHYSYSVNLNLLYRRSRVEVVVLLHVAEQCRQLRMAMTGWEIHLLLHLLPQKTCMKRSLIRMIFKSLIIYELFYECVRLEFA